MNIVRKFLLWLCDGVPDIEYRLLENAHESNMLYMTLKVKELIKLRVRVNQLKSSIRFGAQCPMCARTYEIYVDITKPLTDKKQPAKAVHCKHCKKYPVMWWYSEWDIISVKEVKK